MDNLIHKGGCLWNKDPDPGDPQRQDLTGSARMAQTSVVPDAAVVAARDEVETVLIDRQAGHRVQVGHHAVDQGPGGVVVEPDVSVLVGRDGQWQGRVGQHSVDRTTRLKKDNTPLIKSTSVLKEEEKEERNHRKN